jgi:hypothetical protein
VREFLEGLQVKKEELVQVGVVIDDKDYLSTIISSLPFALSNFASAQLAAARMYASTKTIDPDVLMSLLVEEADRQKAQLARRRVSEKGKEDERDEALSVGAEIESKPRKGKGRANVTCWNCDKRGHYSSECREPKKSNEKDDAKTMSVGMRGTSATAIELDLECEGAWSVLPVEPMDWFEQAAEIEAQDRMREVVFAAVEESPIRDWFDEVAEGECESRDQLRRHFGRHFRQRSVRRGYRHGRNGRVVQWSPRCDQARRL